MMNDRKPIISIEKVSKRFGAVRAVDEISLDIYEGDFFALLGPSGCGKTTLLRMLAGFEVPTSGVIKIDDADISAVPPNRRPVNMVFQSYAVFPHMSVADNVAYGLKVTGVPASEYKERVEEALELVKLGGYGTRMPDQLSGGQRQRVALARALVKRPRVLLLDEPLSALDAKLREAMQLELVRLQETVGITFVIVTHDQSEALSMANRIAVMKDGVVRQLAAPAELYEFPNCRFVADFIGKTNLFEGASVGATTGGLELDVGGLGRITVPADSAASVEGQAWIAVRPEKIRLTRDAPEGERIKMQGKIREIAYYGEASAVFVEDDENRRIMVNVQNEARSTEPHFRVGEQVWCSWAPRDTLLLND
ncbi:MULTISPECIES: ABC transporter ATP-binding protein [Limibacillus]|jgi:spermidine/putrescine ABC transporter ATP-binding subunit|uniref:Spermidine/putrescine import ATP-binding protein PotA n=1 Tax=Limibacillus halophilus TaxID=1579333 RepID=A0A839SQQ0_9PROT|nr:ABC transporter ATP-binding protein [Limibacillus halophilus]MBB3065131.1 spermidine/putrescine ABC transporter ATP-binding subunit [Limibacillus halophilus]